MGEEHRRVGPALGGVWSRAASGMAMTCGEWLFTQEVRSAKHLREGKGTKGVFNVYELID